MHAVLRKVAAVPLDQLDEQVKVWAREVRQASYDMEDILDTFLVRVDGQKEADPSKLKHAMKKMGDLLSKGKARLEISCAINDITKQLQEMTEWHARYRVDDLVAKFAATSIDPRLSALSTKVSQLVGIEEPRDKVVKMLTSVAEDMETKIVSIVGFGGLGKTTLAKAVYQNLSQDVCFKAFVPVGRNPDLNTVLKDILIDLDKQCYTTEFNLTILKEKQLIDELQEFLKDKRYFTTGHSCFAEGKIFCRAHFLGHSAKEIFAECQTQRHSAKKCPRQSSLCQVLGTRQRWTVGKFFLCRGLGTRQILAVGKGGRRDGGHLPLAFAECPTVWRSAKIF
jgi:disease resistance protein RPM1